MAAGAAAVLGHVFPRWHGFRVAAVATSLGVLVGISPIVAASAFGVWVLTWFAGNWWSISAAVGLSEYYRRPRRHRLPMAVVRRCRKFRRQYHHGHRGWGLVLIRPRQSAQYHR